MFISRCKSAAMCYLPAVPSIDEILVVLYMLASRYECSALSRGDINSTGCRFAGVLLRRWALFQSAMSFQPWSFGLKLRFIKIWRLVHGPLLCLVECGNYIYYDLLADSQAHHLLQFSFAPISLGFLRLGSMLV